MAAQLHNITTEPKRRTQDDKPELIADVLVRVYSLILSWPEPEGNQADTYDQTQVDQPAPAQDAQP